MPYTNGDKNRVALPGDSSRERAGGVKRLAVPGIGLLVSMGLLGSLVLAACGTSAGLETAPGFSFSLYQGEDVLGAQELSLADLRGKPVVLNFWAGLCPPCRSEMPDLQEFYADYGNEVTLFGLDVGPFFVGLGSRQDGKELLKELEVSYPAGYTSDAGVVREYEVLGMPSTYFITADGKIFRKWGGLLTKDKLAEIIHEMLGVPQAKNSGAGQPSGGSS